MEFRKQIQSLQLSLEQAAIRVQTLGDFRVWLGDALVAPKAWGRDKTIQLFQFLLTNRRQNAMHKEQIIDRIWENLDAKSGEQTFKVALHGIHKVLEPNRKSRSEPQFVLRQGSTYRLHPTAVWIDAHTLEEFIKIGNLALSDQHLDIAVEAYRSALDLYLGIYLPNRLYDDWTSAERERIQILVLGTMILLGELLVDTLPLESIRLAQEALLIDATWEDAYRLQMQAYFNKGNRPMALKTYQRCKAELNEAFGINPLPETQMLLQKIKQQS